MNVAPLVLTRHFKAPPARVFAAFVEKSLMQAWYGPEGRTTPRCDVDARIGGQYRVEMHSPAGTVHIVTGEFKEIDAPERLVFTWAWLKGAGRTAESLVTITLRAKDGGTDLTLEHSGLASEDSRSGHGKGWISSWNSLDNALAGHPKSSEPVPTVIGVASSTNVQSVLIAFAEKGVACRLEPARPQSSEVLALNPFGKVPAFRCGEISLYESGAIMHYIDEAFDGPGLMPESPAERAKAEQWLSALNCYAYPAIAERYVLQYLIPRGPDGKPNRATIDAAVPEIAKILDIFEAAYGANDALVGNQPSLPDFALAPMIYNLNLFPEGKTLVAARANLKRAHEAFAARPSFKSAMQSALK